MSCVAVIPARGGSKRIPRKNIKLFNGKPMICYAIEAIKKSKIFDAIYVSTEDDEIADTAIKYGAKVPFMRPLDLADDHAATLPVVQYQLRQLLEIGIDFKYACCVYPCVPFLSGEDLNLAYQKVQSAPAHFVYPVAKYRNNPYRSLNITSAGELSFVFPQHELSRTQDLRECYFDVGQFYFASKNKWLSSDKMHSSAIGIIVDERRFVDIDTDDDWSEAESRASMRL